MRIVLSNSSVKWGGVHVVTETLARGLSARGHDITVYGAPGSILEERMCGVAPFEPILHGMDLHPVTLMKARRALQRGQAQVVIAMMKKDVRLTVPAAWSLRIPSIVRHANDRPLTGWIYDQALFGGLPALHIANSNATRDTLLRSASWLRAERVMVIHNGTTTDAIDNARPAALGLDPDALVFGFVGRLEKRKGLLDLMMAWQRVAQALPSAHLVIAGKGPDEGQARQVGGDAPRIHWLGYRADIPSLLRALHAAVVPSHWEGFGLSALEAMIAGLPVVATNASSLPEIVSDDVTGLLVEPGNPGKLARAMIRLAEDSSMRARMGAAGRQRALSEFSEARMIDGFEKAVALVRSGGQ